MTTRRSGTCVYTRMPITSCGEVWLNGVEVVRAGTEEEVAQMDGRFEAVYEHLVREALDVSVCLEGSAALEGPSKDMVVRLRGGSEDTWPISLTNDLDLATLFAEPQAPLPGGKPR